MRAGSYIPIDKPEKDTMFWSSDKTAAQGMGLHAHIQHSHRTLEKQHRHSRQS